MDATAELLCWHRRLGHLPFPMLQRMSTLGLLPKRLQHCPHPWMLSRYWMRGQSMEE